METSRAACQAALIFLMLYASWNCRKMQVPSLVMMLHVELDLLELLKRPFRLSYI